jgi:hypothetical protein
LQAENPLLFNYFFMQKLILGFILLCSVKCMSQQKGFSIVPDKEKKQVNILYNGKLLTAYCYYDSSRKPVLFPVNTVDGITVTRSYPFKMVPGERTDHPHHTGIWLNYESVNGLDFWNNSTAIAPDKRDHYGTIVHKGFGSQEADPNDAELVSLADWVRPDNKVLLNEKSEFKFYVKGNQFIIDRTTKLTATDIPVVFKDVKDGMFAIRVARELELPSKESSKFVDDKGNITNVPPSGSEATGMYYGSTGLSGDSVWSSKGPWVMLTGKKEGKDVTIAMFDHPSNTGYPTYWHARGYGLFALNPLGRKVFSNGKEELNFTLQPGQSVTFRYRIAIVSGKMTNADMNRMAADFAKKK